MLRFDPARDHVRVRGTMVSTHPLYASLLSVRCLETWGLPNRFGTLLCDGYILRVWFDDSNHELIHVHALRLTTNDAPFCLLS